MSFQACAISLLCSTCCLASRTYAQARPVAAHAASDAASERASSGASSTSGVAEGRRHFALALEHYRKAEYREALHELSLADRQVPSPELWFNMARAHERLGEIDQAVVQYKRYLDVRGQALDAAEVQEHVAALEASIAQRAGQTASGQPAPSQGAPGQAGPRQAGLRIDAEAPGTLVKLDGKALGVAPIDRILWIEPGRHALDAELAGHAPFHAQLDAPPRSMVVGAIAMEPRSSAGDAAARMSDDRRAAGAASLPVWIAGAAASASVVASTAARVTAESIRSTGDRGAAQGADRVANVTLATALASSAAAVVFYLAGSRAPSSPTVSP